MNRKLCLLFLVCLAVVLVKSESSVEIDENGDEYDVKRFNIQGRQLNGGRSQCVVTRRKRATQPKPMYSDDGSNDEVDDKNDDGDTMLGVEQQSVLYYSPPVVNPTADEEEEDDKDSDEGDMKEMNKEDEAMEDMKEKNDNEDDEKMAENENEEDDGDNDTIEVVQLPQLPILGQLQSDGETVAAVASASSSSHAGHHNANRVGANGIVVVQSHTPPKVNPQTHAVFELVPVNHANHVNGVEDDEEEEEENHVPENFVFNEELSPVTTTAIWSTGDDNSNLDYNDFANKPVRPHKVVKKVRKPLKANKKKQRKSTLRRRRKNNMNRRRNSIKNKNKKKSTYKRRLTNSNKKRRNNRRRPYRTSVRRRRPVRRNKLRRGSTTRRRVPQSSSKGQLVNSNNSNKNSLNSNTSNKNKGSVSKNKLIQKKNKNKKHSEIIDQGAHTYTRTMTMTQTGDEDGDRNVNCIIIRKDPPPTTARPFWNILGRSANGTPKASGHFGQRKRVNVRFVA